MHCLPKGTKAIRLLQRKEGHRQLLLSAANYGRLSTLMYAAFGSCNLTITDEGMGHVLRQGVNLVGAGLLDMIKKHSGQPDDAKVLGFVGMLLAARDVRRQFPDALVGSFGSTAGSRAYGSNWGRRRAANAVT